MAGPRQPRTKKAAPRAADDLRRADREQAEDALRESEEMQRILLEGSPDPIFSFTPEGRYRYVNQAFAEGVGKTVEGIVGKTIWDILSQEEADKRFAALSQVLRTGEEVVIEGRVPRADGDRYFVTTISPLKDPEGRVTSAICSAKDITAREHAEEALRQSEERHREMIAGISDVIAIMAVDGTLRYKSPNIERHFGWLPEDLVGTNGWETVHPDDLERIQREFLALLDEHDSVVTVEYRYKCKDGGYKMIELTATNLTNSPLIDGVLMNYHDITERKQAEDALRESEQMYEDLVNALPQSLYRIDLDGRTTFANRATLATLGVSFAECVGKSAYDFYPPELAGQYRLDDQRVIDTGETFTTVEDHFLPADRKHVYVEVIKVPVRSAAGDVVGIQGMFWNVTERKQAEDEIQRLNAELEERVITRTAQRDAFNRELEAFAYSAAHDLRAPLRAIDGFSKIVIDDAAERLTPEEVEHLERVRAAAQRMAQMIDDLMGLSKVTRRPLLRREVDVSATAREVAEELRAAQPRRRVEVVVAPGMTAAADPALLRLVLVQLLDNAWKFTSHHDAARIEVGVAIADADADGGGGDGAGDAGAGVGDDGAGREERVFFVRDDGAGFDMGYAKQLFGAFQRFHAAGEFEGGGIGLAMVQRLVLRHGGRVWAEAEVEKGATFFFTLPRAELAAD